MSSHRVENRRYSSRKPIKIGVYRRLTAGQPLKETRTRIKRTHILPTTGGDTGFRAGTITARLRRCIDLVLDEEGMSIATGIKKDQNEIRLATLIDNGVLDRIQ
jgi:hypothetical protein